MNYSSQTTVGEVVAADFRTASIFRRHGIDYCCGGRRSLAEACRKNGMTPEDLIAELESGAAHPGETENYAAWPPSLLADYIEKTHHDYVRRMLPELVFLAEKVARVHGDHAPYLVEMHRRVDELADELLGHMAKEEQVLFPYVRQMETRLKQGGGAMPAPFTSVQAPIACMIEEHELAGSILAELEKTTGGFTPPEGACTSWKVYYGYLADFQRDLHKHVHLENNILFKRAEEMEGRL